MKKCRKGIPVKFTLKVNVVLLYVVLPRLKIIGIRFAQQKIKFSLEYLNYEKKTFIDHFKIDQINIINVQGKYT